MVGPSEVHSLPAHNAIKQSNICSVWYHTTVVSQHCIINQPISKCALCSVPHYIANAIVWGASACFMQLLRIIHNVDPRSWCSLLSLRAGMEQISGSFSAQIQMKVEMQSHGDSFYWTMQTQTCCGGFSSKILALTPPLETARQAQRLFEKDLLGGYSSLLALNMLNVL